MGSNNSNMKEKYKFLIMKQIEEEYGSSDKEKVDFIKMKNVLNKYSVDDLERAYDAFQRFGVKTLIDSVKLEK